MKKIKHLFISFLFIAATNCSFAQTYGYDTTQYYGKMNWIYYNVNTSRLVTSGFLRDYGIDFLNLENQTERLLDDRSPPEIF